MLGWWSVRPARIRLITTSFWMQGIQLSRGGVNLGQEAKHGVWWGSWWEKRSIVMGTYLTLLLIKVASMNHINVLHNG